MSEFVTQWGHGSPIKKSDLIAELRTEVKTAVGTFAFDALNDEISTDAEHPNFVRVVGSIPVSMRFFDAFFHGPSGYRAEYAKSVQAGERFNIAVVTEICQVIRTNGNRYVGNRSSEIVAASLRGPYSKVWLPKGMTDPAESGWDNSEISSIRWSPWVNHWSGKAAPHKGILAYTPARPEILLNGTFVHELTVQPWNQKPSRSREIHETGWT